MQKPGVKLLAIGALAAGAAKSFPGQFIAPFVTSTIAAIMLGLAPDIGQVPPIAQAAPQPQLPGAPTAPTTSPGT